MPYKEIDIPVQDQQIKCKQFEPENNTRETSVVMSHGWSSSDEKYIQLGEMLREEGFVALAVNLRGHKNSPYELEVYSRKQHEEDVVSALEYMREQHPSNAIVLLGKSYSGYLSAIMAEREGVDFLILSHPALYPDEEYDKPTKSLIDQDPDIFKQSGQTPETNTAIRGISNFSGPVLFIESENDEEVPQSTTDNYLRYAGDNVTHVVIPDADHSLTEEEWREEFYRVVVDWLKQVSE